MTHKDGCKLRSLSSKEIHEPWLLQKNLAYPKPIVDNDLTQKVAKEKIWDIRKTDQAKDESRIIFKRHGSRKKKTKKLQQKNQKL